MLVVTAVPYSLQCTDAHMLFQSSESLPHVDALLVADVVLYVFSAKWYYFCILRCGGKAKLLILYQ